LKRNRRGLAINCSFALAIKIQFTPCNLLVICKRSIRGKESMEEGGREKRGADRRPHTTNNNPNTPGALTVRGRWGMEGWRDGGWRGKLLVNAQFLELIRFSALFLLFLNMITAKYNHKQKDRRIERVICSIQKGYS
jgi:hypothetical protein